MPIPLTSICCKVMEHIIHSSVLANMENNNILVLTINDLGKALDSGDQIDGIFLDFSKAIGEAQPLRSPQRQLVVDPEFPVRPYTDSSATDSITTGVHQGTVLSPLLFLA